MMQLTALYADCKSKVFTQLSMDFR